MHLNVAEVSGEAESTTNASDWDTVLHLLAKAVLDQRKRIGLDQRLRITASSILATGRPPAA